MTSNANTSGLEVVALVVSAHGDPEAFGEREIEVVADLSRIPYRTDLVTAASAQARIAELEARIEYLRRSRDGHAAQAHAEFEKRVMAVDALISAREALHHHYVEWDGEPEDAVPLQEPRSECDRVLAALQQETQK